MRFLGVGNIRVNVITNVGFHGRFLGCGKDSQSKKPSTTRSVRKKIEEVENELKKRKEEREEMAMTTIWDPSESTTSIRWQHSAQTPSQLHPDLLTFSSD